MSTLICACGSRLNVKGIRPGKSGLCPSCGGPVRVPGPPASTPLVDDEWGWEGEYAVEEPPPPAEVAPPSEPEPSGVGYGFLEPSPPPRAQKSRPAPIVRPGSLDPEPWFPPRLFFPARGLEGLMVVAVLGVAGWVMGTLVPEYCLGLTEDAQKSGAVQMGHLISLVTAIPVFFFSPLVVTYWLQYLGRVLVNGAEGERNPPRPPDRNADGLFTGMGAWFAWLVLGLGGGLVPLAVGSGCGVQDMTVLLGLGLAGLPYTFMALLLSFLHDEDLAARPWKVLAALARVGPSFLILSLIAAGLLGSIGAIFWLVLRMRAGYFWVYIVTSLPCWCFLIWMTLVTMHTLGSYQAARRTQLRWRRPEAWWNLG